MEFRNGTLYHSKFGDMIAPEFRNGILYYAWGYPSRIGWSLEWIFYINVNVVPCEGISDPFQSSCR